MTQKEKEKINEAEQGNKQEKNNENETPTVEELMEKIREMESNFERGVQKIISEKKGVEQEKELYATVLKESTKVGANPAHLIELSVTSPNVAKEILDTYYGGMDLETFKIENELTDYQVDVNVLAEKKAEALLNKKLGEKMIETHTKGLSEDEKSAFDSVLKEIVGDRVVDADKLPTYLEYADKILGKTGKGSEDDKKEDKKEDKEDKKEDKKEQTETDKLIAKFLGISSSAGANSKGGEDSKSKADDKQSEADAAVAKILGR